jgi:hypothetical protein
VIYLLLGKTLMSTVLKAKRRKKRKRMNSKTVKRKARMVIGQARHPLSWR